MSKIDNLVKNVNKIRIKIGKHSPLILTGLGVAGLCATGYLSYKSAGRVKEITEDIEIKRENNEPVDRLEFGKQLIGAIAAPVIVGTLSITAIIGSYHVLNNRNSILASALATASAERAFYKKRMLENNPNALTGPVENEEEYEIEEADDKGKKKKRKVVVVDKADIMSLNGEWFDKSSEYYYDDFYYNQSYIEAASKALDAKFNKKGVLLLNEVYSALHMPTSKAGTSFGWTDADRVFFELDQTVYQIKDESGQFHPEIFVSWPEPRPVYGEIDYNKDL